MSCMTNVYTSLVRAATRVGGTLATWHKAQDRRSARLVSCELQYFQIAAELTRHAIGKTPTAADIDTALSTKWHSRSDQPSVKVAAAREALREYFLSGKSLQHALMGWRRVMKNPCTPPPPPELHRFWPPSI